MENSAGLSSNDIRQPVWASKFLWENFPEIAKWDEDVEQIVLHGVLENNSNNSLDLNDLRSRAVAYFQVVDQIQREELPVCHLSYLQVLVSIYFYKSWWCGFSKAIVKRAL